MSSASQHRPWDVHRLPAASGSTFLVTGGNAGIGYFTSEQLAATGAHVVLGSRDRAKADAAMASIRSRVPEAHVSHLPLDLADLTSLKAAVGRLELDRLDAVVHNAGVALDDPPRRETGDGHELMFGTNHLGHFALTQWLAPLLSAAPAGRVVTVGSFAARSNGWTSAICNRPTSTCPSAPTAARSSRRCLSVSSSIAGCVPSTARRSAWWPTPAGRWTPHAVPSTGVRDHDWPATARPARGAPGAGQGGRSAARRTGCPRPGGAGRTAVGAARLRTARHTAE